jgi:hypothetical protein
MKNKEREDFVTKHRKWLEEKCYNGLLLDHLIYLFT